jgi:hypothetical protein
MNTIFNYKHAGCVVALLLTVILSQTKFFNFFVNTILGRTLLIFLLLIISYVNQILGIVFVLLIIIIFNNNNINNISYLEGFTETPKPTDNKKTLTKTTSTITTVTSKLPITNDSPSVSTPANVPAEESTQQNLTPTTTAQEGFDIIGKERNIQRGRSSNSIPVNDFMRESSNVLPYENSNLSENFTQF